MAKKCYVCMPYGKKLSDSGAEIDFDRVYRELIEPAVAAVGYEACTLSDNYSNSGVMETTVRLISESDAMLADITTRNPNVMYELGIRHSFIPTRTLIIQQLGPTAIPFDLSNFFVYRYPYPTVDFPNADLLGESHKLAAKFEQICADTNANVVYRNARYARLESEYQLPLKEFHAGAPYDRSVFVMTKYPNKDPSKQTENDRKLQRVIDNVINVLQSRGYTGRLASDRPYHPILWKNIEIYLLGCSKGVAIVENKYTNELNPNIAMEWGWMRASSKDVLYLLERESENLRADFSAFISESFSWDFPEKDIELAINKWLGPQTKPA
jgi:nucleoside 2-deoxyribosyltransferase